MKVLKTLYRLFVIAFCAASGAGVLASYYWIYFDTAPPGRLIHQAERFTMVPVANRADAEALAITEAVPGQTVYRWVEWCLDRPVRGVIERHWTNGELHQMPPTMAVGDVGCHAKSVAHKVPSIQLADEYTWHQRVFYFNNPLTTTSVEYPVIRVRVAP